MYFDMQPRFYLVALWIAACCAAILLALYLQPVPPTYNNIFDDDPASIQRTGMGAGNGLTYGGGRMN